MKQRQVVLYIGMSLDGYIADSYGKIDWLDTINPSHKGDYGYQEFSKTVDTVFMGYNTYYQITNELSPDQWPYEDKISYVFTDNKKKDTENIKFVSGSPVRQINELQKREGRDIWICGGANLVQQLVREDAIDRYHLSVMPVLLGRGLRLFSKGLSSLPLTLVDLRSEAGAVISVYERK